MQQFNYPTTILFGEGALLEGAKRMKAAGIKRPLIVTDQMLVKIGIVDRVQKVCKEVGITCALFADVHPNPIEDDVEAGGGIYKKEKCDSIIALGGGSPIDAAKVIGVRALYSEPLATFDAAIGGYDKITKPLPPIYAIPTTAGTGSDVGRSGVIVMRESNTKTVFFHPSMLPRIAILEPELTRGLPPAVTAATGIDAFTHCLESYFAPIFHPMADGIALEGLRLVLKNLPIVVKDGNNLQARGEMLLAASMGAAAFQKDLGMVHSLAHPLSSECGLHHGLANALMLPKSMEFIEKSQLNADQKALISRVQALFAERGIAKPTLAASCAEFFKSVGIQFGLRNHGVKESQLNLLADKAVKDGCHKTNMIPVTREDLYKVYKEAY